MSRSSRFQNIGLIRDNNLSDVEDPKASLTNLLNDLVTQEDVSFIAEDLDAINNISTTALRASDFRALSNISVERSALNEQNQVIQITAEPFITIKNQIDSIILTTDDPPFFNGGNGLAAEFWESTAISDTLSKTSTGADVFSGAADVTRDVFWDNGFFQFSGNIDDTLAGSNGGIQWTGFYIPDATGTTSFSFNTSGLFMLELENDQGTLEVVKSIYDTEITITSLDAVSGTTVEISAQDYKHCARGSVLNPGQSGESPVITSVNYDPDTDVYSIDLNNSISLAAGEQFVVSVANRLGLEAFLVEYPFRRLAAYQPREIRITYWFPGEQEYFFKVLDCNFSTPNRSGGDLPFWYLYTEVNNTAGDGFVNFFDNRLPVSGGTIGPESVDSSQDYKTVATISPLLVKYEPPRVFSDILRASYSYSREENNDVLSTTGTSPFTSNLEIGNAMVGDGISNTARIIDIAQNNVVVITEPVTSTSSGEIDFIDHRGLVSIFQANSDGSTVTISDTDLLKPGMVVITRNNTSYIRITKLNEDSSTTFETDSNLNLSGTETIFVYQDKGIQNDSLDVFCEGVIGKETGTTGAAEGSTTIQLNNTTDLVTGMVVQSTPFLLENTEVTSIDESTNTVTIDRPVQSDMIEGITVVFAPSGTTLNKEQCVIPLNTAPPFSGTDTGLATSGNVTLNDGDLNVVSINAENATTEEISPDPPYDRLVALNIQDTKFYILGSTG